MIHEKNYHIHDLELVVVVFTLWFLGYYFYGVFCKVIKDHDGI